MCKGAPKSTLQDWKTRSSVTGSPVHLRQISSLERPLSDRSYTLSTSQKAQRLSVVAQGEVSHQGKAPLLGRVCPNPSAPVDPGHPVSKVPPRAASVQYTEAPSTSHRRIFTHVGQASASQGTPGPPRTVGVTGPVNGPVSGDFTGPVNGPVISDFTIPVTVTGDLTGPVIGPVTSPVR